MSLDVLSNYREATVGTTLNNTDPAGTSDNITVSAVTSTWVNLAAGQQMRVMDKADLGATSGYEIMILTADNSGVAGTWTLTRGAEGSTVKAHTANWTMVPASTAGGLVSALGAGRLLGRTQYMPGTKTQYSIAGSLTALDTTNLAVTFTTSASGPGSTEVEGSIMGQWETNAMTYWGFTGTGAPSLGNGVDAMNNLSPSWQFNKAYFTGLTAGTTYTWYLAANGGSGNYFICGNDYSGLSPAVIEIRAGLA